MTGHAHAMGRLTSTMIVLCALLAACGDDPPPGLPPTSSGRDAAMRADAAPADATALDAGVVHDSGEVQDALPNDTGLTDDATLDATTVVDAAPADATVVDAAPMDAEPMDAEPMDAIVTDTGLPAVPDADGDTISDADEGNGGVDTDMDTTPDSLDADSDNDGIDDIIEAGDADPSTPPRDSDMDGTPDFRDTDSDNDGIPDSVEGVADPDNDGIPNYLDTDSDNDGIPDSVEGSADPDNDMIPNFLDADADGDNIRDDHDGLIDSDGDGIPNYLDLDSDDDTIADSIEAGDSNIFTPPNDGDFDGTPDFLDADSDNDRIADRHEGVNNSDGDSFPDRLDIDSDNDSILDDVEAGDTSTTTPPIDSDMDMIPDFIDEDSDNDTILDITEGIGDVDGDMTPDRLDDDSDGDGWSDAIEAGDTDPMTPPVDTDADRIPDFRDLDSDGDGLADSLERGCAMGSTERALADSDNDTFVDPAEIAIGSDPCDSMSIIDDFYFVLPPNGPGDDAPLVFSDTEIDRADFAISVDTTGSMQGEIDNIRLTLSAAIIPGVNAVIPDAAFGVASFDDYPIEPFGFAQAGDLPFRLGQRITTDPMQAQSGVNGLTTQVGADFPESGMEALYQIATGVGTSWNGGSVPAFDPNQGRIAGVADGEIGGIGFRDDSLPVVVHVTDSISHSLQDYSVDPSIAAASTPAVRAALSNIGARVVTISSGFRPYNDLLCDHSISTFYGAIAPAGGDVDWFEIVGAAAGDVVVIETFASRSGSELNPRVAVANAAGIIAEHDDIAANNADAMLTATLTGTGPFYAVIAESADTTYGGTGGVTAGYYIVNMSLNGQGVLPTPSQCRMEDANTRTNATPLLSFGQTTPPASRSQCITDCESIMGPFNPLFQDFTYPYEMSEDTNAVVPPCAWSQFGPGRPTNCPANECCTGRNGEGTRPNNAGLCPLSFEIDGTGVGIDTAMITGIEALVKFSTFTITTVVRPDPAELAASGLDTTCFIHGVIPVSATPPNSCAPAARTADLVPPSPELDSFENVVPGTVLSFQVNALNQGVGTSTACVESLAQPQLFRAFIDVVADGVTVVDTRDVIVIVPPTPPGGSN